MRLIPSRREPPPVFLGAKLSGVCLAMIALTPKKAFQGDALQSRTSHAVPKTEGGMVAF